MARRAFVPPPTFGTEPLSRPGTGTSTRPSSLTLSGLRSTAPPPSVPPGRTSVPPAPGSGNLPESRRSLAPAPLPGSDGVSIAVVAQLLDRLAAADEAPFIAAWIESVLAGRMRSDSTLAVRLLRAYRETGRVDRARDLAASLPIAPTSWSPLDGARLAIERAILATIDGRSDHADAELRLASRALTAAPKGTGL